MELFLSLVIFSENFEFSQIVCDFYMHTLITLTTMTEKYTSYKMS